MPFGHNGDHWQSQKRRIFALWHEEATSCTVIKSKCVTKNERKHYE